MLVTVAGVIAQGADNSGIAAQLVGYQGSLLLRGEEVGRAVMLLSARSPKLTQALRKAKKDGLTHVIRDGTLIHTDRVKADRPTSPANIGCTA